MKLRHAAVLFLPLVLATSCKKQGLKVRNTAYAPDPLVLNYSSIRTIYNWHSAFGNLIKQTLKQKDFQYFYYDPTGIKESTLKNLLRNIDNSYDWNILDIKMRINSKCLTTFKGKMKCSKVDDVEMSINLPDISIFHKISLEISSKGKYIYHCKSHLSQSKFSSPTIKVDVSSNCENNVHDATIKTASSGNEIIVKWIKNGIHVSLKKAAQTVLTLKCQKGICVKNVPQSKTL